MTIKEYEDALMDIVSKALSELSLEDFCKMIRDMQLVFRDPSDPEADSFPVEFDNTTP